MAYLLYKIHSIYSVKLPENNKNIMQGLQNNAITLTIFSRRKITPGYHSMVNNDKYQNVNIF